MEADTLEVGREAQLDHLELGQLGQDPVFAGRARDPLPAVGAEGYPAGVHAREDTGRCPTTGTHRSSRTSTAARRRRRQPRSTGRRAATRTASRRSSCTAARARAARPGIGATSTRTRYRRRPLRPARLRPQHAARERPGRRHVRQHHATTSSPTSSGCASTSASTAGCCSAGRGARRSSSPTPSGTRSGCSEVVLARRHDDAPLRDRLALPRRRPLLPGGVGALPGRRPRAGTRRRPRRGLRAADGDADPDGARQSRRRAGSPGRTP